MLFFIQYSILLCLLLFVKIQYSIKITNFHKGSMRNICNNFISHKQQIYQDEISKRKNLYNFVYYISNDLFVFPITKYGEFIDNIEPLSFVLSSLF
jgi:hypothetical protein